MRRLATLGVIILFAAFLFSCSSKKETAQKPIASVKPTEPAKKISIHFIGEVDFAKSFAHIMAIEDEKEASREERRVEKSNPVTGDTKQDLLKKLEPFGFIKGRELLLNRFHYSGKVANELIDSSGKRCRVTISRTTSSLSIDGSRLITAYYNNDSVSFRTESHALDLKYALLDIIPGGFKEIVILDEGYIANCFLYNFLIYEIRTK